MCEQSMLESTFNSRPKVRFTGILRHSKVLLDKLLKLLFTRKSLSEIMQLIEWSVFFCLFLYLFLDKCKNDLFRPYLNELHKFHSNTLVVELFFLYTL